MNSVNIRQTPCNPNRRFSDCVNMEIQSQGCSSGLLASVACPGMQDINCTMLVLNNTMTAAGVLLFSKL